MSLSKKEHDEIVRLTKHMTLAAWPPGHRKLWQQFRDYIASIVRPDTPDRPHVVALSRKEIEEIARWHDREQEKEDLLLSCTDDMHSQRAIELSRIIDGSK